MKPSFFGCRFARQDLDLDQTVFATFCAEHRVWFSMSPKGRSQMFRVHDEENRSTLGGHLLDRRNLLLGGNLSALKEKIDAAMRSHEAQ